jgi:hypothetical protein
MAYPWGIQAVHFTVGLRTSRLKLPYGDNVISIPSAYFNYLGGFPNQAIMEDYSLMDLLRTRAKVLPETLVIIPKSTVRLIDAPCCVMLYSVRTHGMACVCVRNVLLSALVGVGFVCARKMTHDTDELFAAAIHIVYRLFVRLDDGKSLAWFTQRW